MDRNAAGDSGRARRASVAAAFLSIGLTACVEPPRTGNPLLELRLPNLIVTPHIAWASHGAMQFLADQLIDNIDAWAAGTPQNLVT